MSLTIATWNVNSVKARIVHLLDWLKKDRPDIVLLQETKCTDDTFPAMEIEDLGYNLALFGEKSYNGVAILSRFPLSDIRRGLPGDEEDTHRRYIEAVASLPPDKAAHRTQAVRVASVYVPNGQTADSDKFQYKLRFLERFYTHMQALLAYDETLIVGGDYNVAPQDADVHAPEEWDGSVLTHKEARQRFRKVLHLGMYDAQPVFITRNPAAKAESPYTWWDYRNNGFAMDDGLRIDHLLLSPQAADALSTLHVERNIRALDKASDHAPVVVTLA